MALSLLNWSPPVKIATRVGLLVLLWVMLGATVHPGGKGSDFQRLVFTPSCQWAAITTVLINTPVIGQSALVGAERLLGTLVGGWLAFGMHMLTQNHIYLALSTAVIAFLGFLAGEYMNIKYGFGKLLVVTYLVVLMAIQFAKPLQVAVSRMSAICAAVLLYQLTAVALFPVSASVKSCDDLVAAMEALVAMLKISWIAELVRSSIDTGDRSSIEVSICAVEEPEEERNNQKAAAWNGRIVWLRNLSWPKLPAWSIPGMDKDSDDVSHQMVKAAEALGNFNTNHESAKHEFYIGKLGQTRYYLPLLPGMHTMCPTKLKRRELLVRITDCIRKLKCTIWALNIATSEGFDPHAYAAIRAQYQDMLLHRLKEASLAALTDAVDHFNLDSALDSWVPQDNLDTFQSTVEELLRVAADKREQSAMPVLSSPRSLFRLSSWARSPRIGTGITRVASIGNCTTLSNGESVPVTPGAMSISGHPAGLARTTSMGGSGSSMQWALEAMRATSKSPVADSPTTPTSSADTPTSTLGSTGRAPGTPAKASGSPMTPTTPDNRASLSAPNTSLFQYNASGFFARVRFDSFQFAVAELAEDIRDLHHAINAVLPYLPCSKLQGPPPEDRQRSDFFAAFHKATPPVKEQELPEKLRRKRTHHQEESQDLRSALQGVVGTQLSRIDSTSSKLKEWPSSSSAPSLTPTASGELPQLRQINTKAPTG